MTTRKKLLSSARKIIDTQGIDQVSMRKLGASIGLSRSAMYRHFKEKEALLAEIAREDYLQLLHFYKSLTEKIKDPEELLFKVLEQFYTLGIQFPEHYGLMFVRNWKDDYVSTLEKHYLSIQRLILQLVKEIYNRKNINHNDKERDKIGKNLLFSLHGRVTWENCGKEKQDRQEAKDFIRWSMENVNLLG